MIANLMISDSWATCDMQHEQEYAIVCLTIGDGLIELEELRRVLLRLDSYDANRVDDLFKAADLDQDFLGVDRVCVCLWFCLHSGFLIFPTAQM